MKTILLFFLFLGLGLNAFSQYHYDSFRSLPAREAKKYECNPKQLKPSKLVLSENVIYMPGGGCSISADYSNEYNYFNTNPLYRYTSSFIGGAIGGGVFKLADRFKFDKAAFNN